MANDCTITANARLDARDELTAKLRLNGSLTDAELILHAYAAWGEECVKHLIGDFAFAIWDSRARRYFCARDHFGVKPFYFTQVANEFAFSSSLNELRLNPGVSNTLNEIAIVTTPTIYAVGSNCARRAIQLENCGSRLSGTGSR